MYIYIYKGYIGVILGLHWGYTSVILGHVPGPPFLGVLGGPYSW